MRSIKTRLSKLEPKPLAIVDVRLLTDAQIEQILNERHPWHTGEWTDEELEAMLAKSENAPQPG